MAEVTVDTLKGREVRVLLSDGGNVFLRIKDSNTAGYHQAYLTEGQANQIGSALLQAADGKLQEPKYYLHVQPDSNRWGYINLDLEDGSVYLDNSNATSKDQTQFTQEEIDSNPLLKPFEQFKVPVPVAELE